MYAYLPITSTNYLDTAYTLAGIGVVIAIFIAIATIVVIVLGYIWYLHGKSPEKRNTKMGSFLNFDHYYLDKILKVIYLISAVGIAAGFIMAVLASVSLGVLEFFACLIISTVVFAISELFLRVVFENMLLFVQLAIDVRAIRSKSKKKASVVNSLDAFENTPVAPAAKADARSTSASQPMPQSAPNAEPATSPDSWDCPNCGNRMTSGKFCIKCGTPRA